MAHRHTSLLYGHTQGTIHPYGRLRKPLVQKKNRTRGITSLIEARMALSLWLSRNFPEQKWGAAGARALLGSGACGVEN